jgi:hypothetical protein
LKEQRTDLTGWNFQIWRDHPFNTFMLINEKFLNTTICIITIVQIVILIIAK